MSTTVQCPNCYRMLPQGARFCANCGKSLEAQSVYTPPQDTSLSAPYTPFGSSIPQEERNWAMFAHLSALLVYIFPYAYIAGPLLIWMLKRDMSWFVSEHSKEALNYNLSMLIYVTVAALLSCAFVGVPLLVGLAIFNLVVAIVAAVRAGNGEHYRYPLTIRFIK